MNGYNDEMDIIRAELRERVNHPYVMKFIDHPVIDEQKFILLYTILKQSNRSFEKVKETVVATMLVQIALDTHELVGIETMDEDNPFMKQRQLTVLAGDYYSGLYYYLLSLINDISMIKVLSTAIKEINEYKISVYDGDMKDMDDFISHIAMIDSLLVQKVAQSVGNEELKELAYHLLLLHKLNQEKQNFQQKGNSSFFTSIHKTMNKYKDICKQVSDKQILSIIDIQMIKTVGLIETFMEKNADTYSGLCENISQSFDEIKIREKALKEG